MVRHHPQWQWIKKLIKLKILKFTLVGGLLLAYVVKKYCDSQIIIIRSDDDFTQLLNKNIKIIDFKKKKFFENNAEESQKLLLKKIILGDCSDNIPSILPKDRKILSLKKRKLILENNDELEKFLKENKENNKQFEINRKLIDFNYIPKVISNKIMSKIDINNLIIVD